MNFNKEKFSEILLNIKDSYGSINQMAEKTDVTAAYISKLIRLMYDNAPSPEILKKIAENSNGITTYQTLMEVCGYINENDFNSYILGMLGLTEQDLNEFNIFFKELNLSEYEENIFKNIVEKIRDMNIDDNKKIESNIKDYIKNENPETKSKIIKALKFYIKKMKKTIDFASTTNNSLVKDNEDSLEIRAIARDVAKLKPEKKELFKKLLKEMSDKADEAKK